MLKKWEELPENMKHDAVRPYYDILEGKKKALAGKRLMDILFSFILTVLLSPVMLGIAYAIWAEEFLFLAVKQGLHEQLVHCVQLLVGIQGGENILAIFMKYL